MEKELYESLESIILDVLGVDDDDGDVSPMTTEEEDELLLNEGTKFANLDRWELKKKIKELTEPKVGQYRMDEIVGAIAKYSEMTGNDELKKHSKALFAAGRAMDLINRRISRSGM